jgi:TRAP transporter 4TM/12TM fusion protein
VEGLADTRRSRAADVLGFALAAYALYWVVGVVEPQIYRVSFLLIALVLTFLVYPAGPPRPRSPASAEPAPQEIEPAGVGRRRVIDWALIAASIGALAWPIVDFDRFVFRAATPQPIDVWLGIVVIAVVLEATRRTTGWILTVTALAFLAYGYFGPWLDRVGLALIAHRGYSIERLVGTLYMTLEGIFGVPLDVTSTYIILFTIYGAVLEHSGAGRFFVEWASAAVGRSGGGAGPGRTVTIAGYLLGAVSGSGVANTVMLGSVAWPMMRRAGYPADVGGAVLAAAGIGAIMAPPAMGAAAFLIAEYLQISYLQVIAMAVVPAMLYYLSIFLMVEADSKRLQLQPVDLELPPLGTITRRGWHHFASLLLIVVLMMRGLTAFRAVFWATIVAIGLSLFNRETALWPRRLAAALSAGGLAVLPIAATTASAGIIVGVVTLTGLGLKVAGLIVMLAGNSVWLTAVYAAGAVWMLGLAVPVTASYIIGAVMIVPALTQVGVAPIAAHMFVFYYAVLSEVSPPTALSPFAAAAITGGNPFRTTMVSWKYTAPAFVVPFVFTVDPRGLGLLMQGSAVDIVWTSIAAGLGVVAVSVGAGGWMRRAATAFERLLSFAAAALLLQPRPETVVAGAALFGVVAARHWTRTGRQGQES